MFPRNRAALRRLGRLAFALMFSAGLAVPAAAEGLRLQGKGSAAEK